MRMLWSSLFFMGALLLPFQGIALPNHIYAEIVGRVLGALVGSGYSNNLDQALRAQCGGEDKSCSSRQICEYLNLGGSFPIDCRNVSSSFASITPSERAFEIFLNALPKPESCIRYEEELLAIPPGTLIFNPEGPTASPLAVECSNDKQAQRNYAIDHRTEILTSLGF